LKTKTCSEDAYSGSSLVTCHWSLFLSSLNDFTGRW
jgi:hypothetical protein